MLSVEDKPRFLRELDNAALLRNVMKDFYNLRVQRFKGEVSISSEGVSILNSRNLVNSAPQKFIPNTDGDILKYNVETTQPTDLTYTPLGEERPEPNEKPNEKPKGKEKETSSSSSKSSLERLNLIPNVKHHYDGSIKDGSFMHNMIPAANAKDVHVLLYNSTTHKYYFYLTPKVPVELYRKGGDKKTPFWLKVGDLKPVPFTFGLTKILTSRGTDTSELQRLANTGQITIGDEMYAFKIYDYLKVPASETVTNRQTADNNKMLWLIDRHENFANKNTPDLPNFKPFLQDPVQVGVGLKSKNNSLRKAQLLERAKLLYASYRAGNTSERVKKELKNILQTLSGY